MRNIVEIVMKLYGYRKDYFKHVMFWFWVFCFT